MAKDVGFLVCLLILAMDISAGVLSIQAEIAQHKVKHSRQSVSGCRDTSYGAFKLGIAATILLALTHFIANLLGQCTCLLSKQEFDKASPNKILAVAFLILSWLLLAAGFSMLVIGILSNSGSRKYCGLPHHHIFTSGAVLCFFHGLFTAAYYVSATAAAREEQKRAAQEGLRNHA